MKREIIIISSRVHFMSPSVFLSAPAEDRGPQQIIHCSEAFLCPCQQISELLFSLQQQRDVIAALSGFLETKLKLLNN